MKWLILLCLAGCGSLAPDVVGVSLGTMFASDGSTIVNRTPGTTGSVEFDYESSNVPVAFLNFDWAFGERSRHSEDQAQRERLHQAVMEQQRLLAIASGTPLPVVIEHSDDEPAPSDDKDKAFAYMGTVIAGVCIALMGLITFLIKKKRT